MNTINLTQEINNKFSLQIRLINEFNKSIHSNIFRINLKALKDNSDLISFDKNNRWERNPYRFSSDHYDLTEYYRIVLLVNNCKTMFDFIPENLQNRNIIAPKIQMIESLLLYSY